VAAGAVVLFAAIAWAAYAWSQQGIGAVIYADLGARYLVIWTGNYLVNGATYYGPVYLLLLGLVVAVARRSLLTPRGNAGACGAGVEIAPVNGRRKP
jgi:hypothetical protein